MQFGIPNGFLFRNGIVTPLLIFQIQLSVRTSSIPAMNGVIPNNSQNASTRLSKPPPVGPTPPAPASAPPAPPNHNNAAYPPYAGNRSNIPHNHTPGVNGHHHPQKGKKKNDAPVDPATMYESLKNRIAALEEEEVLEEEEERRYGIRNFSLTCSPEVDSGFSS